MPTQLSMRFSIYIIISLFVCSSRGAKGTEFYPQDGHPHFFPSLFFIFFINYNFSFVLFLFLSSFSFLQWAIINLHSKEHLKVDSMVMLLTILSFVW